MVLFFIQFTITHLYDAQQYTPFKYNFRHNSQKHRTGTSNRVESITHNRTTHSLIRNRKESERSRKIKKKNRKITTKEEKHIVAMTITLFYDNIFFLVLVGVNDRLKNDRLST